MVQCAIEGCPRPVTKAYAKLCSSHGHRQARYGDPLGQKRGYYGLPTEERFWNQVDRNGAGGCWIFAHVDANGYGRFSTDEPRLTNPDKPRTVLSHRFAWKLKHGAYPARELNHTCYVRACVNWDHLEEIDRRAHLDHGNRRRQSERAAYTLVEGCIATAFRAIL